MVEEDRRLENPLIPAEALEGLMKKAFQEQTVNPGLFWDAFVNAHLVVPLAEKIVSDDDRQIPMLLGVDPDGKNVVWLFTSSQTMVEYIEKDLKYLTMPAKDLLKRLTGSKHEIVLIGPDGITLNLHPDLVASLAEGKVPDQPAEEIRHIPKDTAVHVGKPTDDSSKLETRFLEMFRSHPEVLEATFIQIADDAGSRLLLGLRLVDESRESFRKTAELIAKAAEGVLEKGKTMDITLLSRSMKDAFEKFGTPFYKK